MRLDYWSPRFARLWLLPTDDPLDSEDADLVVRVDEPADHDDERRMHDEIIEGFYPEDRGACPWCGLASSHDAPKRAGKCASDSRPIVIPRRLRRPGSR
jgi:hypothetical protein